MTQAGGKELNMRKSPAPDRDRQGYKEREVPSRPLLSSQDGRGSRRVQTRFLCAKPRTHMAEFKSSNTCEANCLRSLLKDERKKIARLRARSAYKANTQTTSESVPTRRVATPRWAEAG